MPWNDVDLCNVAYTHFDNEKKRVLLHSKTCSDQIFQQVNNFSNTIYSNKQCALYA